MAGVKGRSGRTKGTPNKRSADVAAKLAAMDCDPIVALAKLAQKSQDSGDDALAVQCYKELCQYVAPKRKAVEHSTDPDNPLQTSFSIEFHQPGNTD